MHSMKSRGSFVIKSFVIWAIVLAILIAPISMSQIPIVEKKSTPIGWSDDLNISNSTLHDKESQIDSNGNYIHIVWVNDFADIVYSKSNDEGKIWNAFVTLFQSSVLVFYPDIAVSGNNVHVVWGNIESNGISRIYYRNSTNNGETWNTQKIISSQTGFGAGDPSIFVNNSNVHVIWHDKRDGSNGEIYYRRSLDGGTIFDNGQGLDQDRRITFSPAAISGINMDGDGSNVSVVWADERNGNWELYWMISKNNGYTWEDGLGHAGQDRRLTTTGDFQHAIAVNGSNIYVVYTTENWPGPTYNIYYLNSSDNGVTWNLPVLLSGPNSASFAPDIDVFGNNIWVMWNDNRDGSYEIFSKNSTDGGITWSNDTRLTEMDYYDSGAPKIALEDTTINVVWEDERNGNPDIYYKRYPDFPDTTPPTHTNEIPFPDSYKDAPGTNVSVHVTDPSGVNTSTIQLYVNGSLVSHTLTSIADGYNVSYNSGGFSPGIVTCRIVADDNYGNQLDYTWNFTVLATYVIPLRQGWNLVSVPFVQVNASINEVLKDIAGKWNYIQVYNSTDPDHWKTNLTYRPDQLNDLKLLNHKIGFWINVTEPNVNLTVRGNISAYTIIPLYAGWNLVGYPTQMTETVGNALWGTGADRVEVFDPSDPYRLKEVGATYVMEPGEGYWVHVPADATWVVDW